MGGSGVHADHFRDNGDWLARHFRYSDFCRLFQRTRSFGKRSAPGHIPGFNKILGALALLTALLTAVYMTRMMVMTFWGSERFRENHGDDHGNHGHHGVVEPHESPWLMTVPLIVLAVLSTIGGLIGVPYALSSLVTDKNINVIEQTLEPVIAQVPAPVGHEINTEHPQPPQETDAASPIHPLNAPATGESHVSHSAAEISAERLLALLSVLIALGGIGIGWVVFQKRPTLEMPTILENKYYVDEIYDAALIHPIETVSREGLWKIFDIGVLDGLLHSIG
jgi:NADH-quinone oxidoreductase subunit L